MDIIILMLTSCYILYKLYSVLGQEDVDQNFLHKFQNIKDITDTSSEDIVSHMQMLNDHKFGNVFTAINAHDNNFSEEKFIKGAKKAFEFIIKAYSKRDKDYLKSLLSPEIYLQFETQIDNALQKNRYVEKILVSIKNTELIDATITEDIATLTVKFLSEQINLVRDLGDEIIEGNPEKIVPIEDCWKFSKDLSSSDPNWLVRSIS